MVVPFDWKKKGEGLMTNTTQIDAKFLSVAPVNKVM